MLEPAFTENVLAAVDRERLIELEQAIVRIPSLTYEEGQLVDYLAEYMRGMGLEVEIIEVSDHTGGPRRSRQPVGWLRGSGGGPLLMFNGHMDHNPVVGHWEREPFSGEIEDGWLYGRGSQDEKGGITAFLMATQALIKAQVPLKGTLMLCPVMGHKYGGLGSRILLDRGHRPDFVINSENSGNGIAHACVGVLRVIVQLRGKPQHFHSPKRFQQAHGHPLEHMAEVIKALGPSLTPVDPGGWMRFTPHPDLPGYPQIRIELVRGNASLGQPGVLEFQIRTVPGQSADTIRQDLDALFAQLKERLPRLDVTFEVPPNIESDYWGWDMPPYALDKAHALVQTLARAHEQVSGQWPEVSAAPRLGAVGDGNIFGAMGIPTVLYGPGDIDIFEQWPTPNERVLIDDIVVAAKAMALAAAELCA